jgi:hypothetical protein
LRNTGLSEGTCSGEKEKYFAKVLSTAFVLANISQTESVSKLGLILHAL